MADALVPYGDTRIILRYDNSVVVWDSNSRRLIVRDANLALDAPGVCPHCRRPYHGAYPDVPPLGAAGATNAPGRPGDDASPEYFRMLQHSLPDGYQSAPSSPIRQLVEPLVPQRSSPATSGGPPADEGFEAQPAGASGISSEAFSQGYFSRFFREEGELGRGGKGVVLLARHVIDRVDLGRYACKRIPVGNDHQWLIKILAEVQLLSNLAHENLVQYKHVWLEEVKLANFGPSVPCAFVLQQYCNGGDLQKFICGPTSTKSKAEELKERHRRKSKAGSETPPASSSLRRLSLDEIYSFFKQITAGINYLHQSNYVHRDLKPSNCLLHDNGSELKVLVSDFGEVQMGDEIREGTGATGTISYCAPEVLRFDEVTGALGEFTAKSDIFSLGMVLHFLCFGQLPYHSADGINEDDEDIEQLKDEISRWSGFEEERHMRSDLPDELYQHLSRLLSTSPAHRPYAADILKGLEALGVAAAMPSISRSSRSRPPHMRAAPSGDHVYDRRPSRISRVDADTSASNTTHRATASASSSLSTLRLRRSPPKHDAAHETAIESEADSDTASGSPTEVDPLHQRQGSLILRPSNPPSRHTSPSQRQTGFSSPSRPGSSHGGGALPPSLTSSQKLLTGSPSLTPLLASPPTTATAGSETALSARRRQQQQQRQRQAFMLRVAHALFFILKLLSLYVPCLPSAMRPSIALPLLALALADLLIVAPRQGLIGASVALFFVHAAFLAVVSAKGAMCFDHLAYWRDE